MRARRSLAVAVALLCVASMAVPASVSARESVPTPPDSQEDESVVQDCAAEPPEDLADPAGGNDVIGWVDGYWYNEPLDLNVTGGLSQIGLERLTARTTARFEVMRCLNADLGAPPVRVYSRERFKQQQSERYQNVSEKAALFDNAQFETLLTISTAENATDVREQNRGATVSGQYNFRTKTITMIADDPNALLIDEEVLVHEVGHAIQDQQFDLSQYSSQTDDERRGISSLIEGDVSFIEQRYLDACEEGLWTEPCVSREGKPGEGEQRVEPDNWGLYFSQFQPYSDGPSLVGAVYESGGWEAVNRLYEEPPESAYVSAFPETTEEIELENVTVPDQSTDGWERIRFWGEPDYDTVGVAGISGMFIAPTSETDGQFNIYERRDIENIGPDGERDDLNPFNYNQSETAGWRGDKLYTYRNATNETGVVWKLAWESPEAAQPFIDSYQKLIEYRGGQRVEGYEYTYTFTENSEFDMAVTIIPDGDRVTIVTAPTVEDLQAIHQPIELVQAAGENGAGTGEGGADGNSSQNNATAGSDGAENAGTDSTDGQTNEGDVESRTDGEKTDSTDGAGLGIVAAVVALLSAGLLAARRR